jgi:predicted Zn-dependent peptidase
MNHESFTMNNGARVHLMPFEGTEACSVLVLFKIGSRDESDAVWGGSHFIEHLMFKGTKRRPKTLDISRELDRFGAHYNAYTGKDVTGYWVKIDGAHADVAVDLLHDMLFASKFDAKEMTREKNVIVEEIKMYEENPIMHIEDMLEEAMFEGHVLGKNIAGTAASVLGMKRNDVIRYRDQFYRPDNMVVVMAGNVPKQAMALLKKTFGAASVPTQAVVREARPYTASKPATGERIRVQEKPLDQVQLALGFPTPGRGDKSECAVKLLANILGGTMSSRLFVEVREKRGLCYTVRASHDAYQDVGMFQIRAGLDVKRLGEAYKTIQVELKKIVRSGVTAAELRMAKDSLRGGLALSLEDSSDRAEFYGRQELWYGKVKSPEEWLAGFEKVTRAHVQAAARELLRSEMMSIAAIGPFKDIKIFKEAAGL